MGGEGVDGLVLVVSELVTNSILHGEAETVVLRGKLCPSGRLRLEVRNGSVAAVAGPGAEDLMSERGRGLLLVAVVMEDLDGRWGFAGNGSAVWCEIPVPGGRDTCPGAGGRS